jgi:aspartyl/asparaginyl beta-hydroxylase (cupin superfamily)
VSAAPPQAEAHTQDAPTQHDATAGLAPMGHSLTARVFMRIVALVERLNLKCSLVGNPPIYDNAVFPWAAEIEREWRTIRRELERMLMRQTELPGFHEISSDVGSISTDRGWKTFLLCGYGFRSDANIKACPETWRICRKIPGLVTAMFSIFEPGKHLPPHRGPYNGVLRLHLGLIVPEPRERLAIRVAGQIYHWQEGKAVIFDDAFEHEAWNHTSRTRVVLFVDFIKPTRQPARFLNWLLLHLAVFTPFIREGLDNQRAWEKKFYARAETGQKR